MSSAAISGRLAWGTRRLLGRQWAAATPTASLHATPSCQSSAVVRADGMYCLKCILKYLTVLVS